MNIKLEAANSLAGQYLDMRQRIAELERALKLSEQALLSARRDERERCANVEPDSQWCPFNPELLGIHSEEDAFLAGYKMGKGAMRVAIRALGDE